MSAKEISRLLGVSYPNVWRIAKCLGLSHDGETQKKNNQEAFAKPKNW